MDWLLNPYWRIQRCLARKKFANQVKEEVTEEFLKILLQFLRFCSYLDEYLWQSIGTSKWKIELRSEDKDIRVLAEFENGHVKPRELEPDEPLIPPANASVVFKNPEAVKNFLLPPGGLTGRRDVLRSYLNNEIRLEGNLNYIYRFGFLATHVQLPFLPLLK
jgi:hypothetical protein